MQLYDLKFFKRQLLSLTWDSDCSLFRSNFIGGSLNKPNYYFINVPFIIKIGPELLKGDLFRRNVLFRKISLIVFFRVSDAFVICEWVK